MSSSQTLYISLTGPQSEYQYKKTLGVAYEYPGSQPSQEIVSSLPYIINNQIMSNNIPPTAPSLTVSPLTPWTKYPTSNSNIFYYYRYPLQYSINNASFAFIYDISHNLNVTTHSIPSTYDPGSSYAISVYASNLSGSFTEIPSNSSSMSWIFDNATGVLTFTTQNWISIYNQNNNYKPYPYITFWRYEGPFGIQSSTWSTSGSNIYNNNSGNVGINTNTPQYNLDISGNMRVTGQVYNNNLYANTLDVSGNITSPNLSVNSSQNVTGYTNYALKVELYGANFLVYKDPSNNSYASLVNTGSGNSSYIQIGASDIINNLNVTGNTIVNGNVTATSFNSKSDYRIKKNVVNIDNSYSVDNLRPVKYTNKITEKEDLGLIAHELQEIYPFLVNGNKDDNEYQSINYQGLIAILINEIKELKNILRKNNLY